jgi:hypothetical protein
MGYEEIPLRNRRTGTWPHGYRSGTRRLRHREVQQRVLPHLGQHRCGTAGRNVRLVCVGLPPLLPPADLADRPAQAGTRRRSAPVLALLSDRDQLR